MFTKTEELKPVAGVAFFRPAEILEIDRHTRRVFVRIDDDPGVWARLAIQSDLDLAAGDEVLVAGERREELFVTGVLDRLDRPSAGSRQLSSDCGAYAEVSASLSGQTIQVFSSARQLVFEYDPASGAARVDLPRGDLEIRTQDGDMTFSSDQDIRFRGRSIELAASSAVALGVIDSSGSTVSELKADAHHLQLASPEVGIAAARGEFRLGETRFVGEQFQGTVKHVRLIANKVETTAKTIVQKATNVYRTVEKLMQLRAGRQRSIIESSHDLKARNIYARATEDFKVQGEQIHLG